MTGGALEPLKEYSARSGSNARLLFVKLDLDGIEKWHYCLAYSKQERWKW